MSRYTLQGSWNQLTGKVKAQWGKFTGRQPKVIDGKRVEVLGKIQFGYGISSNVNEQQIERFKVRNGK
jgi:uncharacterized protein YjbJ (UPF0337 family)